MNTVVHIIEPTLRDEAGHCAALARGLMHARVEPRPEFHVWMRRDALPLFSLGDRVVEHRTFSRALRRVQGLWVYRSLLQRTLKGDESILFSTATTSDLLLLDLASRTLPGGRISHTGRVWVFVHWLNLSPRKERFLRRIATRHPGLEVVCSTLRVRDAFTAAGFARVRMIAYPGTGTAPCDAPAEPPPFRHVLFAGGARMDKGFGAMVDLVAHLHANAVALPISVQCSAGHSGAHPPEITAAIARLRTVGYPTLTLIERTQAAAEYAALFPGAIVVQAYDPKAFADRISGVTLDALAHGSPAIVPTDTWMARQIEPHGAGVALDNARDPQRLAIAIEAVRQDWPIFARAATAAGHALSHQRGADELMRLIVTSAA